jgi:hypothetical protein
MRNLILAGLSAVMLLAPTVASSQPAGSDTVKRPPLAGKSRLAPAVVKVIAEAKPTAFTGKCPATLHWTATLTVRNPPVTVRYEWIRSDGAKSEAKEVIVRRAEWTLGGESWQLGGPKDHLHVWERIHIVAPNDISSRGAAVAVNCR